MKLNRTPPPLPSGLVTVKKGRLPDIFVGVLTAFRGLAQGFDVTGFAPNHYRTVDNGNFGVIVGAKTAIEVRVILDGKMLFEGIRQPLQAPNGLSMDKQRFQALLETPQPHFFDSDVTGNPFVFAADESGLSDDEIIANQIHPGYDGPTVTMEQLHSGMSLVNVRADFNPADFFNKVKARSAALDAECESLKEAPVDAPVNLLTAPITEAELAGTSNFSCEAVDGEGGIVDGADSDVTEADLAAVQETNGFAAGLVVEEVAAEEEAPATLELPLVDPVVLPLTLAPSQGFLLIGVRAIQQLSETEPPGPPDAFSYVGFQLNPWKRHTRALSRLMGRVIVPSKESLNETMRKQGFDHEIPASGPVCACCNGRQH